MAKIKSYTTIAQSKVLAKILPLESADMYYWTAWAGGVSKEKRETPILGNRTMKEHWEYYSIPCGSLAALLNAIDFSTINLHYDNARTDWVASATIHDSTKHCTKYESTRALNPVDACVEMIINIKKLNKLWI